MKVSFQLSPSAFVVVRPRDALPCTRASAQRESDVSRLYRVVDGEHDGALQDGPGRVRRFSTEYDDVSLGRIDPDLEECRHVAGLRLVAPEEVHVASTLAERGGLDGPIGRDLQRVQQRVVAYR